jgi:mRNA interferase RelE/StbE
VNHPDRYTTRFTAAGRRDLDKPPPRILAAVIEFAFGDLARQPRCVGKPLGRELAGQYSARRGPYRLLYRIDDAAGAVWVHRVDHRSGVYRPLTAAIRQSDETAMTKGENAIRRLADHGQIIKGRPT